MKGKDVMTSNVACHGMLWTENSNEHPKTRDQQKHDIEYFFVCKNYTFARSKYVIVSHHIMVMETKHVDAAKNINMIRVTYM